MDGRTEGSREVAESPAPSTLPTSPASPVPAVVVAPELTILTGMSGAGRSTAARCLEDLGWFVVDNLPPGLLGAMVELAGHTHGTVPRIAVVVDVRGRSLFADLRETLARMAAFAVDPRVVYLEA